MIGESDAAHDMVSSCAGQACLAHALAHRGDTEAAAAAQASIDTAVGLSPVLSGSACSALVFATLAAGDVAAPNTPANRQRDSLVPARRRSSTTPPVRLKYRVREVI